MSRRGFAFKPTPAEWNKFADGKQAELWDEEDAIAAVSSGKLITPSQAETITGLSRNLWAQRALTGVIKWIVWWGEPCKATGPACRLLRSEVMELAGMQFEHADLAEVMGKVQTVSQAVQDLRVRVAELENEISVLMRSGDTESNLS